MFDFAFNFLMKFKAFRAQRGAKSFDFAFVFLWGNLSLFARSAERNISCSTLGARGHLADA